MFLSKLPINVASREFRRDYANIHDLHRTILSAFPKLPEGTSFRREHGVLWRLDTGQTGYTLYVQSHVHPDWSALPYGYLRDKAHVRCLGPVFAAIQPGRSFSFRLLANPTKARYPTPAPPPPRGRGKRVALGKPEDQIDWLIRQGQRHGFTVPETEEHGPDVAPSPCPDFIGQKTSGTNGKKTKITIAPVRYDGHLTVIDPDAFAAAVRNGIGPAKSYGCGLLSLAPLQGA